MDGLDIVQNVFIGLRKPAETSLPYKTALKSIQGVIARKKFDLALSSQNTLGFVSDWFTPSSQDFPLGDLGLDGILLPVRLEWRGIGSEYETGDEVPLVNYSVLENSVVGAASFYGNPPRIVFRDATDIITEREYRLIYEPDFEDEVTLDGPIELPGYVAKMIEVEAKYDLVDLVEDESPEWRAFADRATKKWEMQIGDWRIVWDKYVRTFKGKAQVPKRTFFQNRGVRSRTRYFKG